MQVSKKYVSKEIAQQMREKAKPFIDWLEQASEEDEDDDEEAEEEEEVGLKFVYFSYYYHPFVDDVNSICVCAQN